MMKELLVEDAVLRKMLPQMEEAAAYLKKAAEQNQHILLKFDADGDGISAGLNLLKALRRVSNFKRISNYPSPSAVYKLEEALKDLNRADSKETVFVLLDHGANEESVDSLQLLKSYGARIVIIDHHPFAAKAKELADVFVSPILYTGHGASYATGLLAYEIARRIASEEADEKLAWYALQADKSRFASKKQFEEPVAMDYLVHFKNDSPLEFYEKTLADPTTVKESFLQAQKKVGKALAIAERLAEYKACGKVTVALVRLDKCVPPKEYPSKSKLISEFQEEVQKKKPLLVSVGIAEDSVSFRASRKAYEKGFRASELIKELKKAFGAEVFSGGGHDVAASLRAQPAAVNAIVQESLQLIEKQTKK